MNPHTKSSHQCKKFELSNLLSVLIQSNACDIKFIVGCYNSISRFCYSVSIMHNCPMILLSVIAGATTMSVLPLTSIVLLAL